MKLISYIERNDRITQIEINNLPQLRNKEGVVTEKHIPFFGDKYFLKFRLGKRSIEVKTDEFTYADAKIGEPVCLDYKRYKGEMVNVETCPKKH